MTQDQFIAALKAGGANNIELLRSTAPVRRGIGVSFEHGGTVFSNAAVMGLSSPMPEEHAFRALLDWAKDAMLETA